MGCWQNGRRHEIEVRQVNKGDLQSHSEYDKKLSDKNKIKEGSRLTEKKMMYEKKKTKHDRGT